MRKLRIEVSGDPENYACITAYLWLLELTQIIADEFNTEVEVEWSKQVYQFEPTILINGEVVFEGLPSEAGYLYEAIKAFLEKKLKSQTTNY